MLDEQQEVENSFNSKMPSTLNDTEKKRGFGRVDAQEFYLSLPYR